MSVLKWMLLLPVKLVAMLLAVLLSPLLLTSARGRLGYVSAGGLILEVFFISNPAEMAVYQARKWLVAQAIADVLGDVQ